MTLFEGLEDQKVCAEKYLLVLMESLHVGEELQPDVSAVTTYVL